MDSPLVAVCIATYKRPQYLRDLLESLRDIQVDGFRAHVIVVDNDPCGSSSDYVRGLEGNYPFPVSYAIEGKRGISSVRNELIRAAAEISADYLVFVDDDELVAQDWLREMVRVAEATKTDGVSGRITYKFEPDVPRWVTQAPLVVFSQPHLETGRPTNTSGTGNLLLKIDSIQKYDIRFDEEYNLTGGGDQQFLNHFRKKGAIVVAAADAVVYERIPKSRTSWKWFWRRCTRFGIAEGRILGEERPSTIRIVLYTMRACGIVAKNMVLLLPSSLLQGRPGMLNKLCRIGWGLGMLFGLLGIRYQEYTRIHGR